MTTIPTPSGFTALLPPDGPVVEHVRNVFPDALGVYAFGSRIAGTSNTESDLDLAVLLPGYAPAMALWDTAQALAGIAGCEVDLVDLRAAGSIMQHQILTTGLRLWGVDPAAGVFEAFALTEKLDFDAARADLVADIVREGHVHG